MTENLITRFAAGVGGLGDEVDEATREQAAVLLADHVVNLIRSGSPAAAPDGTLSTDRAAREAGDACADDRDDVNWASVAHPGAIIWPVVLELGARQGRSGAEVLSAAAIGYEAMVRFASVLEPTLRNYFHVTALAGPVGAAAAASVLLDDSGRVSVDALGHAISVIGGSSGAMRERSGTRIFHRMHSVRTGIAAAEAAATGLESSRLDLERGGGPLTPLTDDRAARLTEPGFTALATTSIRPFPTGGWNQMVYEATIVAAGAHRGGIRRVIVEADAPSRAASVDAPETASDRWFSLPFAAASAVSVAKGRARESVSPEQILPMVELRDRDRQGARVSIEPTDASAATGWSEIAIPLGHPLRPVGLADLSTSWCMERADTKELLTRIAEWFTQPTAGGNDGLGFSAVTDSALRALRNSGRALL